jgi:hypothetical protein
VVIGGAAAVFMGSPGGQCNYLEKKSVMADPILNGVDVILLLGSEIASTVFQRAAFPAVDDSYGEWRVFGVGCQCESIP